MATKKAAKKDEPGKKVVKREAESEGHIAKKQAVKRGHATKREAGEVQGHRVARGTRRSNDPEARAR